MKIFTTVTLFCFSAAAFGIGSQSSIEENAVQQQQQGQAQQQQQRQLEQEKLKRNYQYEQSQNQQDQHRQQNQTEQQVHQDQQNQSEQQAHQNQQNQIDQQNQRDQLDHQDQLDQQNQLNQQSQQDQDSHPEYLRQYGPYSLSKFFQAPIVINTEGHYVSDIYIQSSDAEAKISSVIAYLSNGHIIDVFNNKVQVVFAGNRVQSQIDYGGAEQIDRIEIKVSSLHLFGPRAQVTVGYTEY